MNSPSILRRCVVSLLGLGAAALVSGCGALVPKAAPAPRVYVIEDPWGKSHSPSQGSSGGVSGGMFHDPAPDPAPSSSAAITPIAAPALIVHPTRAAPGFDSQHIIYVRVSHQLEHFAHADWVDTPAQMLMPLIIASLQRTDRFRAVGTTDSDMDGDLRLDTEVLRLQQQFGEQFGEGPSQVRFTLRATLSDTRTHQVLSWQEFDETVPSASEDPYGGVVAANQAVQRDMAQLAHFCALAAGSRRPSQDKPQRAQALP